MYKFAINYVIVIRKALVTHAKIRNAFLNPVPLYLSSIKIPQKTKESLKIKDSLEATTRFEVSKHIKKPCRWCATRQVDKLNNENFFFPGTVYVPGCLCNVF